jgi:NADPH:quinone reductase-like Zn-dependent oxidoreductase
MKAWRIHRYGGPSVMQLDDAPEPVCSDGDVLIAVAAASLNPVDWKFRERKSWPVLNPRLPVTLGCDVAGTVLRVGPACRRLRVGERVFARLEKNRMGALAERVAADETVVAPMPRNLSFEQAAAVPLAGLTAWQALTEIGELRRGQSVLIHAGAGGVGTLAIPIAKHLGATVWTTCSARNAEFARALGADEVIDYTQERIEARVTGLDLVLDTLGDASELASLRLVRPGGVVVGISGTPDTAFARTRLPWFARPVVAFRARARTRLARELSVQYRFWFMRPDGEQLAQLASFCEAGWLRPVIERVFPFEEAPAAFAVQEAGRVRGKLIVRGP